MEDKVTVLDFLIQNIIVNSLEFHQMHDSNGNLVKEKVATLDELYTKHSSKELLSLRILVD